jgi:hypothetical protein
MTRLYGALPSPLPRTSAMRSLSSDQLRRKQSVPAHL